MKKKLLTTAVLAGIAGTAGAVNVNPDGLGQVGLLPYYTVQGGYDTYVSIVNTTNVVKAVKVRFLEGKNSREVLDFNLYLSPYDVWTGAITQASATGPGKLLTLDKSCTVPTIPAAGESFRNFGFTGTLFDGESTSLARTREGHIEILEMGVVLDEASPSTFTPATWATHTAGVPDNCPALVNAWRPAGAWTAASGRSVIGNTGGLTVAATLINVNEGIANGNVGTMLENWRVGVDDIHTAPGSIFPNLGNAFPPVSDVFVAGTPGVITSTWGGSPSAGLNAVSATLMHDNLINEYTVETGLAAGTDWVVTFPTKALYVDWTNLLAPFAPFDTIFGGGGTRPGENNGPGGTGPLRADPPVAGGACEIVNLTIYDREEGTPTGDVDFSPQPAGGVDSLCWETNVITFNDTDVLNSQGLRLNIPTQTFSNGWLNLAFGETTQTMLSADGDRFNGLPAIGFAVQNFVNGTLSGGTVLSNYGVLFDHRATRSVVGGQIL